VHTKDGIVKFKATPEGLYEYQVSQDYLKRISDHKAKQEQNNMVTLVEENMLAYTDWQITRAKRARSLYHTIGTPTVKNFKHMLKTNAISNCPVTTEDVTIAEKIYGPSMSSLKGKSTRSRPKPVVDDVIEIPPKLKENNKDIELCIDTMYINKVGMLTAIDRTIKF